MRPSTSCDNYELADTHVTADTNATRGRAFEQTHNSAVAIERTELTLDGILRRRVLLRRMLTESAHVVGRTTTNTTSAWQPPDAIGDEREVPDSSIRLQQPSEAHVEVTQRDAADFDAVDYGPQESSFLDGTLTGGYSVPAQSHILRSNSDKIARSAVRSPARVRSIVRRARSYNGKRGHANAPGLATTLSVNQLVQCDVDVSKRAISYAAEFPLALVGPEEEAVSEGVHCDGILPAGARALHSWHWDDAILHTEGQAYTGGGHASAGPSIVSYSRQKQALQDSVQMDLADAPSAAWSHNDGVSVDRLCDDVPSLKLSEVSESAAPDDRWSSPIRIERSNRNPHACSDERSAPGRPLGNIGTVSRFSHKKYTPDDFTSRVGHQSEMPDAVHAVLGDIKRHAGSPQRADSRDTIRLQVQQPHGGSISTHPLPTASTGTAPRLPAQSPQVSHRRLVQPGQLRVASVTGKMHAVSPIRGKSSTTTSVLRSMLRVEVHGAAQRLPYHTSKRGAVAGHRTERMIHDASVQPSDSESDDIDEILDLLRE